MQYSPLTDEQLSRLVQNGDRKAVMELYLRWKEGLYRFCLRLVSDPGAAEDIIHDAFVTLIERRSTVENPARLRSWTYTVVRNEAFTYLNRRRRVRPLTETDEEVFDDVSPLEDVEKKERTGKITELLDRMLPQYREVLLLREYESMNYEEIAVVTGATVSSVKSRLFKARRALYKTMEPMRKASEL